MFIKLTEKHKNLIGKHKDECDWCGNAITFPLGIVGWIDTEFNEKKDKAEMGFYTIILCSDCATRLKESHEQAYKEIQEKVVEKNYFDKQMKGDNKNENRQE